jgi:hypothetical protein
MPAIGPGLETRTKITQPRISQNYFVSNQTVSFRIPAAPVQGFKWLGNQIVENSGFNFVHGA